MQVSTWCIHGQAAGVNFRESLSKFFEDYAPFLPHYVSGDNTREKEELAFKLTSKHSGFRRALYLEDVYKNMYWKWNAFTAVTVQ